MMWFEKKLKWITVLSIALVATTLWAAGVGG